MSDSLNETGIAVPAVVSFDDIMPDDLGIGETVFIDDEPAIFLGKEGAPLWFKKATQGSFPVAVADYLRGIADGSIRRVESAPSPLLLSDLSEIRSAFRRLPDAVRAKADAKAAYVNGYWAAYHEAAARGERFSRTLANAAIIVARVDAQLIEQGIVPPRRRQPRTVLSWIEKSAKARGVETLAHGNASAIRARRISPRVLEEIHAKIRSAVEEFPLLGPTKLRSLVDGRLKEIRAAEGLHLPLPSLSVVTKEFNRHDAWWRMAQREGRKKADLEYGAVGKLERPERILDLVELDHHLIDLIAVLGKSPMGPTLAKAGLGRMWAAIAIDVASGYPLGFYLSFEGTGLLPALMCLSHAVQEKTYVAERFPHIDGSWLAYGKPVKVRWDNALEFIGHQMRAALARVGIGFEGARPGQPDDKPYIERFNGTLERDLIEWLKGATGANTRARGERNPVKEACLEVDDFVALLHEYLITVYARRPQKGLDWETPEQRWLRLAALRPPRPLRPVELNRHDVLASLELNLNATDDGIRWRNLFFQSSELQHIRRFSGDHGIKKKKPTPVQVRIPMRDIGIAYVTVPNSDPAEEIAVPCTNRHARGRTLWQHDVIQRLMRSRRRDATDASQYGAAFETLFKRSLNYMGVVLPDGVKVPLTAKGASTAARFAGVLVDGMSNHANSRVASEIAQFDVFGVEAAEVATNMALAIVGPSPDVSMPSDWKVDDILLDDDEEEDA